jgi:hypothetical protein
MICQNSVANYLKKGIRKKQFYLYLFIYIL